MNSGERITHKCPRCGYTNVWIRKEILQRGKVDMYKSEQKKKFSLRCKNQDIDYTNRTSVEVPVK
jgi:predicted nucleic-acid-binding Zn-ribbon protein